jgi:hypothetical protein
MRIVVRKILLSFVVALILSLTLAFVALTLFRDHLVQFLTVNKPVTNEYLVVEGWVDDLVLDSAARIFEAGRYAGIVVTGSAIESEYLMSTNGLLEYSFQNEQMQVDAGDTVLVCVRGTPVLNIYPFFVVQLNGNTCYEGFASEVWQDHPIVLDTTLQVNELGIYFGNDEFLGDEDRNLHIKHVMIGGRVIPARSKYSHRYASKDQEKLHPTPTNFKSVAGISAYKLEQNGVSGEQIIVLPSPASERHRTLASAWAVKQWLQESGLPQTTSLNILSESIHSRRSYILYQSILKENSHEIGIISVSLLNERYLGFNIGTEDIIKELAGSFYYRFLLNKRRLAKRISSGSN